MKNNQKTFGEISQSQKYLFVQYFHANTDIFNYIQLFAFFGNLNMRKNIIIFGEKFTM